MRALKEHPDLRTNEKFMLANAIVVLFCFFSILLVSFRPKEISSLYFLFSIFFA
jgi:hypothetical protein